MSRKAIRIIAISVIALILGYLVVSKMGLIEAEATDSPPLSAASEPITSAIPVKAIVVQPSILKETISVSGTIYPDEEVVIASEVNGKITTLNFREGSRVSQGQLLVKVDDAELRASLKKLAFQIQLAQQQEVRKKKLLEIGGISQEEYDESLTAFNTLEAEKALLEVQIAKTGIRAPFSGIVGLKKVSQGSYLTPGSPIADLVKTDPVRVEFSVPEKYGNRIGKNATIQFSVEGSAQQFEGKVYAKSASIDMETRTLLVVAKSDNPAGILIPGAYANVAIFLAEYANAIMIPTEAIVPEQGGQKVFLIRDGMAQAQAVKVGIRQSDQIQILEGLQAGDQVITSGLLNITPGAKVLLTE